MTTQKEKGHALDVPPKLQQLPGRSSNKLQGRLYSNAGRGCDRGSLQKMSAEGGRTLVASQEKDQDQNRKQNQDKEKNVVGAEAVVSHTTAIHENNKSNSDIKKYLSGALLFLAGIVVGNVVIPLFTTDQLAGTEKAPMQEGNNTANNSIESEITSITPITSSGTEEEAGCSIADLSDATKGCSAVTSIDSITSEVSIEEKEGCSITALSNASKGCSVDAGTNNSTNSDSGITNLSNLK
ncbi:MAG TPA: hypothetical protein ENJ33_08365 [Thiothrix sp.]|nr:hypothetical protein [Thiothrix sp.]